MAFLRRCGITAGAALLLAACNDQPTALGPTDTVAATALPTAGVPGWELADTARIQLVDDHGRPVAGETVTWTVIEGNGSIEVLNGVSDADGYSSAVWTLGAQPGPNRLRASTVLEESSEFEVLGELFRPDAVSAEQKMACGVVSSAIWCWGEGFWSNGNPVSIQPGDGLSISPGLVDATREYTDVAVSGRSVCGLATQGEVWCATTSAPDLVQAAGLPLLRQIAGGQLGGYAGGPMYCGLAVSDSTAWCWSLGEVPSQVPLSPALGRIWISYTNASGGPEPAVYRACGLRADSTAVCWGRGVLGDGVDSWGRPLEVVDVSGGHRFVDLTVGNGFSCRRTTNLELWCWGRLAAGTAPPVPAIPELAGSGVLSLGADSEQAAAYLSGGTIQIWERTISAPYATQPEAPGPGTIRFAFNSASCVLAGDRTVYCANLVFGLGTDTQLPRVREYLPVQPIRVVSPAAAVGAQ